MQDQAIVLLDASGHLVYINQVAEQLFGCSGTESRGQYFSDTIQIYDRHGPIWSECENHQQIISQSIQLGTAAFSNAHQEKTFVIFITVPVIENEQITGLAVLCCPFAESVEINAQRIFQEIAAVSSQPLITLDKESRVSFVNPAAQQYLDYSSELLLQVGGIQALFTDPLDIQSCLKAYENSSCWQGPVEMVSRIGVAVESQFRFMPVKNAAGDVIFYTCSCADISEVTERHSSVETCQEVVDQAESVIIKVDRQGKAQFINAYARSLLSVGDVSLVGNVLPKEVQSLLEQGDGFSSAMVFEGHVKSAQGMLLPILWSISPMRDSRGSVVGLLCIGNPATAQNDGELGLQHQHQRALLTMQNINEGVIGVDVNGDIEYLNPVAERLTGWRAQQAYGKPLVDVFKAVNDHSGQPIENLVWRALRVGEKVNGSVDCLLKRQNDRDIVVQFSCTPMQDAQGQVDGAVLVFEDITEKRGIERQLMYQASHDTLTGLLNRREFEARLTKILSKSRRTQQENVLMIMDIEQFKVINNTCGHVAGDVLLKQITALLHTALKERDDFSLARLGGDEFGLLLYNNSLYAAGKLAEEVSEAIEQFRFSWFDKSYMVGISIGMAKVDANSGSLAEVLSATESACYVAKDKGRNHIHLYQSDDAMLNQRRGEMQWLHRINQALKDGQFCLYHQKILPLNGSYHQEGHSEILVRMIDEQKRIISPASFISAAERYQLMSAVDKWVIRAAFTILSRQQKAKPENKQSFSINLSGQTLGDENALDYLVEQTKEMGINPESVCFEVTETAAINNMEAAKQFINEMKQMGYHFALDDFGSGMSSFGYLKDLPVDYLKIDGSFVRDMLKDETNFALVESINNMGHVMGVQTIAEYVENDATLQRLWELGVDHVQGFCMAKPTPLWQSFNSDMK